MLKSVQFKFVWCQIWRRRRADLLSVLRQNAAWVAEVHAAPTVAEEYGLTLLASAWAEHQSGNADATD